MRQMTNMTQMQGDAEVVTADDLKRAFEAGVSARNRGLRRDPPWQSNSSSDMAVAWICGWDSAEGVKAAAGQPWADESDPRTTVQ